MNQVVVGVVAFLLGVALIVIVFNIVYPYIQHRAAEERFYAARAAAIALSDIIEKVTEAGVGSAATVRISLPPNTVVISGPNSIRFVVYGAPPYQAAVNVTSGAVTYVGIVPKGSAVEVQINATSGWTFTTTGVSIAGRENTVLVNYTRAYQVELDWEG